MPRPTVARILQSMYVHVTDHDTAIQYLLGEFISSLEEYTSSGAAWYTMYIDCIHVPEAEPGLCQEYCLG